MNWDDYVALSDKLTAIANDAHLGWAHTNDSKLELAFTLVQKLAETMQLALKLENDPDPSLRHP